jgi:tRNA A37 threonylcarbamoyladenosine biosynthesis protein TsaE
MEKVYFNYDKYAKALASQLLNNLNHESTSLTIGLFGEWGSGKTKLLQLIQEEIEKQENKLIVPVFFNAWRYEKEEHLIIPLLKTAFYEIKERQQKMEEPSAFKDISKTLGNIIIALAAGFKGKFLGLELSGKDFIERLEKEYERDNPKNGLDYESIYYDITEHFKHLTDQGVRFLFLVDDLDRCLPENSIKMLEAIKLFLDIQGCAFVLALDDEVIERGVEHHYKEYIKDDSKTNMPITGNEYLEKMIQLPFKIPLIKTIDIEVLLRQEYKHVFIKEPLRSTPNLKEPEEAKAESIDEELLRFFASILPPIPRKIIRSMKLFETKKELGKDLNLDDATLARLCLLELFIPKLYRLSKKEPALFGVLQEWKDAHANIHDTSAIRSAIEEKIEGNLTKEVHKKILDCIDELKCARINFDLDKLFPFPKPDDTIERYFTFMIEPSSNKDIENARKEFRYAQLRDEERFLSDVLSFNSLATVKGAIQKEQLLGQVLSPNVGERLVSQINNTSKITAEWLEVIAPYVSEKDFDDIIQNSDILNRLVKEVK